MKRKIAIIILLSFCLTACGKSSRETILQEEKQQAETTQSVEPIIEERNWTIEEQILPDADTAVAALIPQDGIIFTEEWHLVDEAVYRLTTVVSSDETVPEEDFFKGHCVQKIEPPYVDWVNAFIASGDWIEGESCEPWSYSYNAVTGDGVAILLEGENGAYLGEWNEEGTTVTKIESTVLTKEIFSEKYGNWQKTKSDGLYLWGENEYIHLDNEFAIKDKAESDTGRYVSKVIENNRSGELYLVGPAKMEYDVDFACEIQKGIEVISLDGKEPMLSTEDVHVGGDENMSFVAETEGYLYQSFCMSEFSLATGNLNVVYDFHDDIEHFDIMYNEQKPSKYMSIRNGIQGGYVRDDGSHILLVACGDGTYQIWKMSEEKGEQGNGNQKEILEWATTIPSIYEERAVAKFNHQSEEYKVVFRVPEDGENFEDFRTRIQAEVAAGKGPDILSEGSVMEMEDGVNRGFLLDITDSFSGYQSDILSSVWQIGLVEDKRYAMPYSYTITTLVANEELINGKDSWTLDDAISYMQKSEADCFMAGANAEQLFFSLGLRTETNSQLVDWQNNISNLNSEKALELLEFSELYADSEGGEGNDYLRTAEGKAAAALLYLISPEEMRVAAAMFNDHEAYVGFPVENGESGHVLSGSGLMVNQGSSNPEGAIEFIEFMLSEEIQLDMADKVAQNTSSGFPVRSSAMEQVYRGLQKEDVSGEWKIYGGLEYEAMPLTDESIAKLRELVMSARPVGNRAAQVFDIMSEEMGDFRTEEKSPEQVLDIVDNRVQLYLDEIGD